MKLWSVTFYSPRVKDEIAKLPKGILAKYVRLSTLMETYGPDIGMPHTRYMGNGLLEMRLKSLEGIARVFYATVVRQEIVILHSIIKKTDKTPKKDLGIAYKRLYEVKS
jgi:phage-related protein